MDHPICGAEAFSDRASQTFEVRRLLAPTGGG